MVYRGGRLRALVFAPLRTQPGSQKRALECKEKVSAKKVKTPSWKVKDANPLFARIASDPLG
jgi:hypothetical protein